MKTIMVLIQKRKQKGFTLIELMIVVAIIGVLAAIAAPNFARYQSKARQAEAKIALAAIYGGEKAFYSEYSAYIAEMSAIGYVPEGSKRYYTVGWSAISTGASIVTGYANTGATPSYARTNFPSTWTDCSPALGQVPATGTTDPQAFTSTTSGQVRQGTGCDVWTINENKVLSNVTINL